VKLCRYFLNNDRSNVMCIYIHIYTYIHTVYTYIYTHTYIHDHKYTSICNPHMKVYMNIRIIYEIYINMYNEVKPCQFFLHKDRCVTLQCHLYIRTYIHIYTYIFINTQVYAILTYKLCRRAGAWDNDVAMSCCKLDVSRCTPRPGLQVPK